MKYLFLSFLALFFSGSIYSQITLVDTPHCLNHVLHAEVTGGIIPTSSGITADDNWSGVIPIGFTYNFYGIPNTQCIIGSNGCLGFDLANAFAYNTWPIGNTLLASTGAAPDIINCICGPWCDVYIPSGGTIDYSMQGTAPNRNFAVTWCGTAMYSCTTEWLTTQIVIYETTGIAEVHIGHRTICSTGWNGQHAICGVKDPTGTIATAAPGRDYPALWTATNEAWRFTPSGATYTVSSIPYAPIPYAASGVYWYDSTTGAFLGTGPNLTVTPGVPTTYIAAALGCNDTTKAYIHVLPSSLIAGLGLPHISNITYTNPTVCGKCDGSVTLYGVPPHEIDSVIYSIGGVQQPIIVDSSSGPDSTINLTGLCAGTYDYFYVKVGECPSNEVGPITMAAPPLNLAMNYTVQLGCNGDIVLFNNLSTPASSEYATAWYFGDGTPSGSTTNISHTYMDQPGYNTTYTDTLIYSTLYGCQVDTVFSIPLIHPVSSNFSVNANAVCIGTPIEFTGTTVSQNQPSYTWNFGDDFPVIKVPAGGTNTDTNVQDYTYPVPGYFTATLTVEDTIGCQVAYTDTFDVISLDVHTSIHDTSVCLADSMTMWALPPAPQPIIPSYIPYTYSWTPTNNIGQASTATTNFFGIGNYVYTVQLTTPPLVLNPGGCTASDTEKINSFAPVTFTGLTPSPSTIPYGSSIQLNAGGAVYYTWAPDNGTLNNNNISDPIATPTDSTTIYTVFGRNLFGCVDSANITVNIDFTMTDDLPTAFTPNNDGLNDVFKLHGVKYQRLVQFSIYNRWGIEVFRTNNPDIGWDGTYQGAPQDMGVYYYQITVAHPDGADQTYKGNVTLIR